MFKIPTPDRDSWVKWAAGFIDGEGCITIQYRPKSRTHYLKINAVNCVKQPLEILQALFGGRVSEKYMNPIHHPPHHRQSYVWECAARQASIAISELQPWLVAKKDEAGVALAFQSGIGRARWNGVDEIEYARRETLRQRLKELKGRKRKASI